MGVGCVKPNPLSALVFRLVRFPLVRFLIQCFVELGFGPDEYVALLVYGDPFCLVAKNVKQCVGRTGWLAMVFWHVCLPAASFSCCTALALVPSAW